MPLVLELALGAGAGRAQQGEGSRFAFADTTLLRDTLGLHFDGLFPIADSLGITPDTLRALAIRYRYRLDRLVFLSDSMHVPVDSVGVIVQRERFNPLSSSFQPSNAFHYGSTYSILQTSSSWFNASDYNFVFGPLFVRNITNITMDQFRAGGRTSLRQTRSSSTESGWRFSPNLSVGGRANLDRFNSGDPGNLGANTETKNEFQLSVRTRQQFSKTLNSDFSAFAGQLHLANDQQVKRGFSTDLGGHARWNPGHWLTNDVNGQVIGNVSRTRVPTAPVEQGTHDLTTSLRGTSAIFSSSPVGLNLSYNLRNVTVQSPTDSGLIQSVKNVNNGADLTLKLRQDNDRYLSVSGHAGTLENSSALQPTARSTKQEINLTADGRYVVYGWLLQSGFTDGFSTSKFPLRSTTGGYGESLQTRTVNANLNRSLTPTITVRVTGDVSLSSYRYFIIGSYASPPVPRDQYRQSYRIEGSWTPNERGNSSLGLDVIRSLSINIPSASTGANNEVRTYRADWRWSYRLLPGLTATQRNQIGADYTYFTFQPTSNRLALDYSTVTTLNAVLTPRFTIDVTHNGRFQPSGSYTRDRDTLDYFFRPADEDRNYTLTSHIAYSPSPAVQLTLDPNYQASNRDAASGGTIAPQRHDRTLNFSGGATLNFSLGKKGHLTGNIQRTYRADRSISFTNGVAAESPRSESDYWNGRLELSWDL